MENETRFRLTKSALLAVKVPEGKPNLSVFDNEVRGLGCRISKTGGMVMFIYKKVNGRPVRKTLGAYHPGPGGASVEDFRSKARVELGQIADDPDKWLEGEATVEADEITIEKAFSLALKASKRGTMALRDWNQARDKFMAWLKANHPHIVTWAKLRRVHVREYMEAQQPTEKSLDRGITALSPTRLRLIMQPVSQTARFMWLEHEIPNVAERLGLSARLVKTPAPVYLEDVLGLLDHLRDAGMVSYEAGAALAALAGLQLLEALRLTWNRVDLRRGLVEVSGEVKNPYRSRVIPIPARCLEALKRASEARTLEAVESVDGGHVITSSSGAPFIDVSWQNYSVRLGRAMKAWNPKINWAPKDLRNCIMTLGALRGFAGDVLEQYVGHAPRSVTARNYIPRLSSASIGEAAELDRQMKVFRKLVVDHVENEIEAIRAKQAGHVIEIGARKL